jgi:hypothetical protein
MFFLKSKGFKWVVLSPVRPSERVSKRVSPFIGPRDIQGENWLETLASSHLFCETCPTLEYSPPKNKIIAS